MPTNGTILSSIPISGNCFDLGNRRNYCRYEFSDKKRIIQNPKCSKYVQLIIFRLWKFLFIHSSIPNGKWCPTARQGRKLFPSISKISQYPNNHFYSKGKRKRRICSIFNAKGSFGRLYLTSLYCVLKRLKMPFTGKCQSFGVMCRL